MQWQQRQIHKYKDTSKSKTWTSHPISSTSQRPPPTYWNHNNCDDDDLRRPWLYANPAHLCLISSTRSRIIPESTSTVYTNPGFPWNTNAGIPSASYDSETSFPRRFQHLVDFQTLGHMVLDHREVYFEASFNPHLLKIKLNVLLIREAPFFFPIMSSSSINYSSPSPPAPPSLPFPQSTQRMLPKLPGGGSADNQSWAGHLLLPLLFLITATLLGGSRWIVMGHLLLVYLMISCLAAEWMRL